MVVTADVAMRVVLIGPPGAGKGTQAPLLCGRLGIVHISTGDMIRERIASATSTELKAKPYVDRGELVPDAIIVEMVSERIGEPDCTAGFLLDGFPRTPAQAAALDRSLASLGKTLSAVLIVVEDEEVVRRLSGRRTCPVCKENYHVESLPSKIDGKCDRCGGDLTQREDDRAETIRKRLAEYHQKTAPVLEYYKAKGILRSVSGMGTVEEIHRRILAALRA
jgi:adenylate kinase